MSEEEEVVAHAKISPEGFGRLYDTYYQPIFGFFLKRTRNVEAAKDLTSETFFQALKNLHRYSPRPGISFKSWLFAIAVAQSANYYRGRAKFLSVSSDEAPEIVAGESFEANADILEAQDGAERAEQVSRLRLCMARLNQKQQNVLSLRYFSQMSLNEIGRVLNMKENTVKSHLHRALNKLQTLMTDQPAAAQGNSLGVPEPYVATEPVQS